MVLGIQIDNFTLAPAIAGQYKYHVVGYQADGTANEITLETNFTPTVGSTFPIGGFDVSSYSYIGVEVSAGNFVSKYVSQTNQKSGTYTLLLPSNKKVNINTKDGNGNIISTPDVNIYIGGSKTKFNVSPTTGIGIIYFFCTLSTVTSNVVASNYTSPANQDLSLQYDTEVTLNFTLTLNTYPAPTIHITKQVKKISTNTFSDTLTVNSGDTIQYEYTILNQSSETITLTAITESDGTITFSHNSIGDTLTAGGSLKFWSNTFAVTGNKNTIFSVSASGNTSGETCSDSTQTCFVTVTETLFKTLTLNIYPIGATVTTTPSGTVTKITQKTTNTTDPCLQFEQFTISFANDEISKTISIVRPDFLSQQYGPITYNNCPSGEQWVTMVSNKKSVLKIYSSSIVNIPITEFIVKDASIGENIIKCSLPSTAVDLTHAFAFQVGPGRTYTISVNGVSNAFSITTKNDPTGNNGANENPLDLNMSSVSSNILVLYSYPYGNTITITGITKFDTREVCYANNQLYEKITFTGPAQNYKLNIKRDLSDAPNWTYYNDNYYFQGGVKRYMFLKPTNNQVLFEVLTDRPVDSVYCNNGYESFSMLSELPSPGLSDTYIIIDGIKHYLYGLLVPKGSKNNAIAMKYNTPNAETGVITVNEITK